MKRAALFLFLLMPFIVNAQTVSYIRQDTVKHIAKGNNTKWYHDNTNDVYRFDTEKDSFAFNKPVSIEGVKVILFNPLQDSVSIKPNASEAYSAGKITYDTNNKVGQFNLHDEANNTKLQVGYETWIPPHCYNNTASTIQNGKIVYIDTTINGFPTISLADNRTYKKSRIIGVATQNLLPYSWGTVTNFGLVSDLDMSGRSSNVVFLGQNGNKVYERPTGGVFPIRIGYALNDDTLLVYINTVEYTDETIKAFGFPDFSNFYTTVTFNETTRYAKIDPIESDFYVYQNGTKYILESDSIQLPDIEGAYVVYYDEGNLEYYYNPNDADLYEMNTEKVPVVFIYWDATNNEAITIGDIRHTFHIEPYVKNFLDFVVGASYGGSGLDIANITVDGNGDVDSTAQFDLTSGSIYNEDIYSITPSLERGDTIPIYYLSGSNLYIRKIYEYGFTVLTDITAGTGVTGRLAYNDITTGSLTTVSNNDFVLCHIFGTTAIDDTNKVFAVVGQNGYTSIANARDGALLEGAEIKKQAFFKREMVLLYSIIYQTSNGYGNAVKARVVSALDALGNSVDFIDWRGQAIGSGGAGGGGAGAFLDLTDTPNDYSGDGNKIVFVNNAETALEFRENTFKDSAGVVSVVHNTDFDSVTAAKINADTAYINDTLFLDEVVGLTKGINIKSDSLGLNGNYITKFFQFISANGTESITASPSSQTISFGKDLGTSDYTLNITGFDASGNIVFPTISNLTSTGFDIQININCTINYFTIIN